VARERLEDDGVDQREITADDVRPCRRCGSQPVADTTQWTDGVGIDDEPVLAVDRRERLSNPIRLLGPTAYQ
jgi:hypothetical protein